MERCFHPWMKEALDVFISQLTLQHGGEKQQENDMETEETLTIEDDILSQGVQSSEEMVTSEEEEILMTEEPRIDIVSHQSMQNKEHKSLGTVYCIEVVATEEQTIGSVDQSLQLKVEEQPWNAWLIQITIGFVVQHLQRKEELRDASRWGYSKRSQECVLL